MAPETAKPGTTETLKQQVTEAIRTVSAGHLSYGLLDFPYHRNIGDSAIWLGEVQILRRLHGKGPGYVSHLGFSVEEPGRHVPDGILYLHGGGNFGDIWPAHQIYRENILTRYPKHRIVQLPQSLHYADPEAIERSKRVIGAHPDFHFMVRDQESLDFVTRHFDCHALLVPDCAFGIDMAPFRRVARPAGIKCLFRSDKERRPDAEAGRALFAGTQIEDWHGMADMARRRHAIRILKRIPDIPGKHHLMGLRSWAFNRMALNIVTIGFQQLDAAEVIVTDRLHGHIMSALLEKPHVVIDNFYGKIANFIRAWGRDQVTRVAEDYREAHAMAAELLAASQKKRRG